MEDIIKDLEELEKAIAESDQEIASTDGQIVALTDQLKELDLPSIEAAKEAIEKMVSENTESEGKVQKAYGTLKEQYEW